MKVFVYYRKSDGKLDAREFEGVTSIIALPTEPDLKNRLVIDGVTIEDAEVDVFPEPNEKFGLCANTSLHGVFSNLTQCHWNYSATGRVAFESNIHSAGQTCKCEGVGIVVIFPWFEKTKGFWYDNSYTLKKIMEIIK